MLEGAGAAHDSPLLTLQELYELVGKQTSIQIKLQKLTIKQIMLKTRAADTQNPTFLIYILLLSTLLWLFTPIVYAQKHYIMGCYCISFTDSEDTSCW